MRNSPNPKICFIPDLIRVLYLCAKILLITISVLIPIIPTFSQTSKETIKIGFLIRDKKDVIIQQTAQSAIRQANAQGGYKGKEFELVIKSCDGPWGITSKQAVALIFEDQVPILVTALDGRNAHLAEQVTAKSHVVMLSTLSSDPTLSRAYVPWYFRMVPDDKQQAEALIEQVYIKNSKKNVAIIALDNYDGNKSAETFREIAKQKGLPVPVVLKNIGGNELKVKLAESSWPVIILAGTPQKEKDFSRIIAGYETYAFLNFFNFLSANEYFDNVKTSFSPSLDYVYDGISLAIESIKKFGPNPEAIRIGFKDIKYEGATGLVEFDKLGNRLIE